MKLVLLCGGLGTRIREETEFRPKPMVAIGGKPILWHIMKYYSSFGYSDFLLALGYKGEMIKQYFSHYEVMNNDVTIQLGHPDSLIIHKTHEEIGWKITLSDTGKDSLKGARLKKISKYIDDDTFMVTYGDGLSDVDLRELVKFHKDHGKIATLTGISIASRFGELKIDGDHVRSFSEKPTSSDGLVNGGFFVFNREILDYLTDEDECDLEYGALENIANDGQLMVYKHKGFWACMDTLRDMDFLNDLWSKNEAPWKVW